MCLIFFAHRHHPRYRLVVAANRDEYYDRPTLAAGFWPDEPDILAGRDLLAQGTWLGVTRQGRFAALTNYRSTDDPHLDAPSRGLLVGEFLGCRESSPAYLDRVSRIGERYNGFSLVVCDGEQLAWYSNRGAGVEILKPGLYGLSNHLLDSPWPKVEQGKARLAELLADDGWSMDEVLDMLGDEGPPPDAALPDTGVGLARERMLAPLFIRGPAYGTRSSTVVSMDETGIVHFVERRYSPTDHVHDTSRFELTLDPVQVGWIDETQADWPGGMGTCPVTKNR